MDRENVVKNLRAVLCSSKGNFTLKKANSDYVGLTGKGIPFRELGYKSLADFVSSESTFFTMTKSNGEVTIQAMPEEKSVHMVSLVHRSKTSKKTSNKKTSVRYGETTRRKPSSSNSWKPNKSFKMKSSTYGSGRIAQHSSSSNNQQSLKNRLQQTNIPHEQPPKSTNQLPNKKDVETQHKNTKKVPKEALNKNINTGASLSRNSSMNSSTFSRQSSIDSNISATGSNNEVGTLSPNERITSIINRKSVDSIDIVKDIPKEILRIEPLTDIKFNEILERTFAHQNKSSKVISSASSTDDSDAPVFDYPEVNEFVPTKSQNEYNQLRAWPESSVPWLQSPENTIVDNSPTKSRGRGRTISTINRPPISPLSIHSESDPCSLLLANLTDLIRKLKLDGIPIIKLKSRTPKYGPPLVLAKLKIGTAYICSTWPTEFPAEDSARLAVLQKAYIELSEKLGKMDDTTMPESDPSVIGERLIPIVKMHTAGIWADTVEELYREKFKEKLPSNWLPIAKKQNLSVEYAANGKCILCVDMAPKKSEQVEKPNRSNFSIQSRLSRPLLTKEVELSVSIPEIELPSGQWCDILITRGLSTCNLWFQIIGNDYSKKYESLVDEMEKYFSEPKHLTIATQNQVKKGDCYALFENETWARTRILNIYKPDNDNTKQEFHCLSVDDGHEYKVTIDKLYILPPNFAVLPAQAVHGCLCGLEELNDIEFVNNIVEELVDHQLCAEIVEKLDNSEFGKSLYVTLYDTSESMEDLCINRDIINKVYNKVPTPVLNTKGSLLAMTCAFIDESNHVYLHRTADEQSSFVFNELMERMAMNLEEDANLEYVNNVKKVDPEVHYLAKYTDNIWYRCKIIEVFLLRNAVKIMYIDFGNTQDVEFNQNENLIQLDKVSNILTDFPPQCVKAELYHTVPKIPTDTYSKLQNILQDNSVVIVKITVPSENTTQLPVIELFQRLKSDDQLISLNKQLELIKLESKKQDNNNNKSERNTIKVSSRLQKNSNMSIFSNNSSLPSTGNIPKPNLPELKKMFYVRIPNASSPWNFFVQPYVNGVELKCFMEKLQEFYNIDNYKKTSFQFSDIKQGEVYAACHLLDSQWYRTCVNKVIDKNSISAYFIDFGAYVVLKSDQLLPLDDGFKQFPFQAIKARLTGVRPLNETWTVEGCKIFQENVVGNVFVAYLEEISADVFNSADIVLNLKLIDTSKSDTEDYHIDKVLIEKGIAIPTTSRPSSISSNASN